MPAHKLTKDFPVTEVEKSVNVAAFLIKISPSNFERILWVWKDIRSMISRSGNHILDVMVIMMTTRRRSITMRKLATLARY